MRKLLLAFLLVSAIGAQAETPLAAKAVLKNAQTQAAKEHKNVMVIFHASWCGWCHKMEDFMALPQFKPLFEKSYVIVRLDTMENGEKKNLENAGADEVMKEAGGVNTGIPYFYMTDAKGKMLINSKRPSEKSKEGENIGHPAAPEEIAHFMTMLRKTSKLDAAELGKIEAYLKAQKLGN